MLLLGSRNKKRKNRINNKIATMNVELEPFAWEEWELSNVINQLLLQNNIFGKKPQWNFYKDYSTYIRD